MIARQTAQKTRDGVTTRLPGGPSQAPGIADLPEPSAAGTHRMPEAPAKPPRPARQYTPAMTTHRGRSMIGSLVAAAHIAADLHGWGCSAWPMSSTHIGFTVRLLAQPVVAVGARGGRAGKVCGLESGGVAAAAEAQPAVRDLAG